MKVLSVVIPCFNSANYMEKCIESLLIAEDDIEIIIVDDGSKKDNTKEIAENYAQKYPGIIKAISKENGGHGSAVNVGIENAQGRYFKVVDSDDWVDKNSLLKIIEVLKNLINENQEIDMLISNFIYDKVDAKKKKIMHYRGLLPENKVFNWSETKKFKLAQYILMHSVIYKTELLKKCGLKLPEHTFYVDNIYVYYPLVHVEKMYYLDINFYHYFIGREDQSVNETIMISRIEQQIKVNKILFDSYDLQKINEKCLRRYMYKFLSIINSVSCVLLIKEGSKEKLNMKKQLWQYMKSKNKKMYIKLKYFSILGITVNLRSIFGRKLVLIVYEFIRKKFGFN